MTTPLSPKNANATSNSATVAETQLSGPTGPPSTAKPNTKRETPSGTLKSPTQSNKKEAYSQLHKSPSTDPRTPPASPPQQLPPSQTQTQKKVSRRSSKPIINWFQRKLAGTGRTRRASEGHGARPPIPHFIDAEQPPVPRRERTRTGPSGGRPQSTPGPIETSGLKFKEEVPPVPALAQNTISLNGDDTTSEDAQSRRRSSLGPESMWSPSVAVEADEDASLRPIPPSAPPSPSPSHSSSSYLSDPRTFRSLAASTKPTTVLSVDLGNGMAHIAEAPPTPLSQITRLPQHARMSSLGTTGGVSTGGSITFAALPQTPLSATAPSAIPGGNGDVVFSPLHAPQHTVHHPRDNPRPSSPPPDDASMLTLASSAFGVPGARLGANALSFYAGTSTRDVGDSTSHFPGPADSTSQFVMGEDDEVEREQAASTRALRSRRSWESQASRWSARIGGVSLGPGTPLGDRSLWAGGSLRTGTQYSFGGDAGNDGDVDSKKSGDAGSILRHSPGAGDDDTGSTHAANGRVDSPFEEEALEMEKNSDTTSRRDAASDVQATPQVSPRKHLPGDATPNAERGYFPNLDNVNARVKPQEEDREDTRSFMTGTDGQTEVWVSAPSTPLGFH
jgi:hypothetical protein